MAGIARVLRQQGGICVHRFAQIGDLAPLPANGCTLLIFDRVAVNPEQIVALAGRHPTLTLVGIDAERQEALVYTTQRYALATIDDLVRLVDVVTAPTLLAPHPAEQGS